MNHETALLFLHGFPLNPSMWRGQKAAFGEQYAIAVPDLRLTGKGNGRNLPDPVTMEEMADAAITALDAAGAERCVVVGLSMGGYVAFALQQRYPERVAGLVLVDTKSEGDSEEAKEGRRKTAEDVLANGADAFADTMIGKLLGPKTIEHQPQLVTEVKSMMLAMPPAAIASAALGMAARPDRTPALGSIKVPTLVVVGEDDAITPPDGAKKMADAVPGAELAIIPDAGHLANMEQQEAFNRILSEWLEKKGL